MVTLFIGAFSNAALAAAIPIYIGLAFAGMLRSPPDLAALRTAVWGILISQAVRAVLQLGRNFSAELLGQRLERDIRDELYVSLIGKSMTFHDSRPVGDTMARATNDVREINLMFNPGINLVVGSAWFLAMPLLVAPRYHWSLTLTPALFILGYIWSVRQFLRELQPITEAVRNHFGRMNARLAEALEGIETVKGAAQEPEEVARFDLNAGRYRDAFVQQGEIEARFLPMLLLALATTLAFVHALWLHQAGRLEVSDVVAYMGLLLLFGFPTFVSLFSYSQVSLGLAGAARILELIQAETKLDENKAGHAVGLNGALTLENVDFSYTGLTPALQGVSFDVRPGQTVAIVGQTGAGKTTLAKLVNRTYDVSRGRILVDGVDVRDWNLEKLRQQISIIEQDVFLFSRTIAENVAFGCPGASQEEIEQAARAAQAHDFILSFRDGYQTVIGERGVTLSGGQRQRIALARAFLTDPRILILDDSTSAIDSETEDQIQRAIFKAAENRTTLIITHRLSQIRWADLILVLRQGRLAAAGTHEELMRTSDAYRRIFMRYEEPAHRPSQPSGRSDGRDSMTSEN